MASVSAALRAKLLGEVAIIRSTVVAATCTAEAITVLPAGPDHRARRSLDDDAITGSRTDWLEPSVECCQNCLSWTATSAALLRDETKPFDN